MYNCGIKYLLFLDKIALIVLDFKLIGNRLLVKKNIYKTLTCQLYWIAWIIYSARAFATLSFSFRRPFAICIAIAAGISIFHFWLSLRFQATLALCLTMDIIFKFPTVSHARIPLYILCLLALFPFLRMLYFFFLFIFIFSLSSWNAHFLFSRDAVEYARSCQTQRTVPRSSIFRESSSSLRPLWGVSSETSGEREREDFLSTAPREIDELPRDRTERRKENTTKKCKVSRAHSKHRRLRSYAARFQRLGRHRFHWTGKSQFAGCPENWATNNYAPWSKQNKQQDKRFEKRRKKILKKTWKKFLKIYVAKKVIFKSLLICIIQLHPQL